MNYNLVQLVEAWINKDISTEDMKKVYSEIPVYIVQDSENTDGDPNIGYSGSGNTMIEVQAQLVYTGKISIDEFHEWAETIIDIYRPNIENGED